MDALAGTTDDGLGLEFRRARFSGKFRGQKAKAQITNMPLWPVAAREARAAARAPRTYAWRAAVTAIGIAIIPMSLTTSAAGASPGRAIFGGVAMLAFLYCIFGGVLRTADAIAEEKRENTLGLLFLTDLKAADVISGKLLAS